MLLALPEPIEHSKLFPSGQEWLPGYLYNMTLVLMIFLLLLMYSGIDITHPDFGGRAVWGFDAVDNPSRRTDGNGHGTHVAG